MGVFTKAIKGHSHDLPGTYELGHSMSYDLIQDVFYRGSGLGEAYENVYEYVRPLAEQFSRILPYAIDANGKPINNVPAVDALYRPNKQMSFTQFFDALMTGIKTQPEIYILVWHKKGDQLFKGGKITRDNIAGYTFLQGVSKINTDGVITYQTTNSKGQLENYTTNEVIVLSDSRNPANVSVGYSPIKAVQKWITVDDYIVAYQQGYFRNGAVPTGQFIITAATGQEFKDIVRKMQERHRGAGQNNNVTYTHRPIDPQSNKPVDAQVQWIPFNVANKDMELGTLTDNVQKRKESVYGIPAVIRGVDDSANYATAQIMERSFVKYKLDPSTHNIWSTWTHELNRITGGLGCAITYDLDIPSVADEEKVEAETKKIEVDTIKALTDQGYSLNSVVEALKLSNAYKLLKTSDTPTVIDNDKPQVDEGGEVEDSPDATDSKRYKSVTARQFEAELEGLVPEKTGYIMLDTEKIKVKGIVESYQDDLVDESLTDFGNLPGESVPHITVLDGVLKSPKDIEKLAKSIYKESKVKELEIDEISFFDLENSNAIIAKIKISDELKELRDNFDLVPHASKFSVYAPHITIGYLTKEADHNKWIKSLNSEYKGSKIAVKSLNLGEDVFSGGSKSTDPKGTKELTPEARATYESQMEVVAKQLMQKQIDNAIIETKAVGDPTDEDIDEFVTEMLRIVTAILVVQGTIQFSEGIALLLANGIDTSTLTTFQVSPTQLQRYRAYLMNVARSYTHDTGVVIRKVLERGLVDQLSRADIERNLKAIIDTEYYRIKRIGVTETNRAGGNASVFSMENISAETGVRILKVWNTTSADPCEYCRALDGKTVEVTDTFVPVGTVVEGVDGNLFVNDFVNADIAQLHPNDQCVVTFEVA